MGSSQQVQPQRFSLVMNNVFTAFAVHDAELALCLIKVLLRSEPKQRKGLCIILRIIIISTVTAYMQQAERVLPVSSALS